MSSSEIKEATCPVIVNIKGQRDHPNFTLYIGRSMYMGGWKLPASKWHNPYSLKQYTIDESLALYEQHIRNSGLHKDLHQLLGETMGCWCKPGKCHGDVLIKLFKEKNYKML